MSKIMIVEDNEFNMDSLSRVLGRRGFEVVGFENGELALERVGSETPDVILMDIGLPGIDGYETTRALKSAPETRNIPVIALTAHAYDADRIKAEEAGCDDFDTKPVEIDRLVTKIEDAVAKADGELD